MRENNENMTGMVWFSPEGRGTIRQEKLAPDGVEFLEDKSEARWVEESLSEFGKVRALLPEGFSAYARVCFTPLTLTRTKNSRSAGQRSRHGRDEPSIPSCSLNVLPT